MDKPRKYLVCRKVLPKFIEACCKKSPDILRFHAQTVQPELGVPVEFYVIVSNEQFVSYYGIRHIISHEQNHFIKKCVESTQVQCSPLQVQI